MRIQLDNYDLLTSFKIKLRLDNGEIKYHEFNSDIISDRTLEEIFNAIDGELEEIYNGK